MSYIRSFLLGKMSALLWIYLGYSGIDSFLFVAVFSFLVAIRLFIEFVLIH